MPGRRGGTLNRGGNVGNVHGAGRRPNPLVKALGRASVKSARKAEVLMDSPDFEQVKYAMDWVARTHIGSKDARVRANAPAQAAQATQVNVNSYRIVGDDEEIPEGVPALEV